MKTWLCAGVLVVIGFVQPSYAEETNSTNVECAAVAGDSQQKSVDPQAAEKEKAAKEAQEAAKAK